MTRRDLIGALIAAPVAARALEAAPQDEWIPLFDGKSLAGWKANERQDAFTVVDGQIVVSGPRTHLFYTGPVRNADFKNFELAVEALAEKGANSGVYFHTRYQPEGWPAGGFEVQVANTFEGDNGYKERKKTGSLYGVRNVNRQLVQDGEWFQMNILVRGKQVQVRVDGMLVVDYVEPDPPYRADPNFERVLGHGTFALQCHDPGSTVRYRGIRLRVLPDDAGAESTERPVVDDLYRETMRLSDENYPMVDYHVHLKGGLTIDEALRNSRRLGINYGVAMNCGLNFPVHNDAGALEFLAGMRNQPCFVGLQAEGREWVKLVSPETVARFDYVLSDAMTFTDDQGKRMRLWINDEVGEIKDPQAFMEMLVKRIVGILAEPIDIYANPTFLPEQIAKDYAALWTPDRMQNVIDAAVKNGVAIEINNRYKIPSAAFIKRAKAAGVKFSFGTNNEGRELGRLEYPIQMVKECGLQWQDIFVPRKPMAGRQ